MCRSECQSGDDGHGGTCEERGRARLDWDVSGDEELASVEWLHNSVVSVATGEGIIVGHPLSESSELGVADRLHLLDDGPFETLRAGGSGQGAVVAPVCGHVDAVEELTHVNGGWG